jgi:hypothetical protein
MERMATVISISTKVKPFGEDLRVLIPLALS